MKTKKIYAFLFVLAICFGAVSMGKFAPLQVQAASNAEWIAVEGVEGGKITFDAATGTITGAETSITAMDIPASIDGVAVQSIGTEAFVYCDKITTVCLPSTVTAIEPYAFAYCTSLATLQMSNEVTTIGENAFSYCTSLQEINFSEALREIGDSAFRACGQLGAVVLPTSLAQLGTYAFDGSGLTQIEIPASLTSLPEGAFHNCDRLVSVVIPDSVTSIGAWAFAYSEQLHDVVIPDSVSEIGAQAFYNCISLLALEIPHSVVHIGQQAFAVCESLTDLYFTGNETQWGAMITDVPSKVTVHYETVMPALGTGETEAENSADHTPITDTAVTSVGVTLGELFFGAVMICVVIIVCYYWYQLDKKITLKRMQKAEEPDNS